MKMDVKFAVIVEDIKDFSIYVKEIEKLKMEMTEMITSQMLQINYRLQMFVDVLKATKIGPNNN
jgi:hypothetical protein